MIVSTKPLGLNLLLKYCLVMVFHSSSAPNFRGDLKISDQNNWGGPEQKIKFGGELNFRGGYEHSW